MEKRPDVLEGSTRGLKTGCGTLYMTVNMNDKGYPIETFAIIGKAGGCASAQTESIGRLASGWLRSGGKVEEIVHMLKGISCHVSDNEEGVYSCPHAVAIALEVFIGKE